MLARKPAAALAVMGTLVVAVVLIGGCQMVVERSPAQEAAIVSPATGGDVVDTLRAEGLGEFVAALQATGLEDDLRGEGPFTLFAPTDEALAAVPAATREDAEAMARLVQRHIVVDQVSAADLAALRAALTIQGDTLALATAADGTVTVDGAAVIRADIPAANGLIHVIETVLLPPEQ